MRAAGRARRLRLVFAVGCPLLTVLLSVACGARSGLFLSSAILESDDSGTPVPSEDAQTLTPEDALPGIDAVARDVVPIPVCADASDTLIYTVTESNTLLKFNPSNDQFTSIGTLNCPDPYGRNPFSMAVDREGNAYVLYFSPAGLGSGTEPLPGSIFKVNLNTASCAATAFVAGQSGFDGFGMGFASDDVGIGETLYVASGDTTPGRLGAVDEATLTLSVVGSFPSFVLNAELTGTGDGRLFAFYNPSGQGTDGSVIGQLDKASGNVIAQQALPSITQGNGWAFAFWGGSFYTFTSPTGNGTIVQRYNPADGSVAQVAAYPDIIDGAGVSTCAPVQ